jgi:hypothetical protein
MARARRFVVWVLTRAMPALIASAGIILSIGLAAWFYWLPPAAVSLGDRLGWYGAVIGVVSFYYTLLQLYLTKQAAVAAEAAANSAAQRAQADEYRGDLERVLDSLQRAHGHMDGKQWKMAAVKLRDAEWELRRIQYVRTHANNRWELFAAAVLWWADYLVQHGKDRQTIIWPSERSWGDERNRMMNALFEELAVTGKME